jgi:hypothetical protein
MVTSSARIAIDDTVSKYMKRANVIVAVACLRYADNRLLFVA